MVTTSQPPVLPTHPTPLTKSPGLALIREDQARSLTQRIARYVPFTIGFAGATATALYGLHWEPNWFPGSGHSSRGIVFLEYLASTLGGTVASLFFAERFLMPFTHTLVQRAHHRADTNFELVYDTLTDDISAVNPLTDAPSFKKIPPDYQDSILLDYFLHVLERGSHDQYAFVQEHLTSDHKHLADTTLRRYLRKVDALELQKYSSVLTNDELERLIDGYLHVNKIDEAEKVTREKFSEKDSALILTDIADIYFRAKDYAQAERLWKELKDYDGLRRLFTTYESKGEKQKALTIYFLLQDH